MVLAGGWNLGHEEGWGWGLGLGVRGRVMTGRGEAEDEVSRQAWLCRLSPQPTQQQCTQRLSGIKCKPLRMLHRIYHHAPSDQRW